MGISEARLHKMGGQNAKATLDRAVKNVEKRIERLEIKQKPLQLVQLKLTIEESRQPASRIIAKWKNVSRAFGERILFRMPISRSNTEQNRPDRAERLRQEHASEDDRGRCSGIRLAKGARIGYFSQVGYS